MRKTIPIFLFFWFLSATCAVAEGYFPFWWHLHSTYSDGIYSLEKMKEIAIKNGFRGIVMTDHSDCFEGYCENTSDFYSYVEEVSYLNDDNFVSILGGREIVLDTKPSNSYCHIGTVSYAPEGYTYTTKYSPDDLPEFLNLLDQEDVVYVYNHPKDCRRWEKYARMFMAIELLNDLSPKTPYIENYAYHLKVYLSAQTNIGGPFAIGGADYHDPVSGERGTKVATYVVADQFAYWETAQAIQDGQTFATYKAQVLNFSPYPMKQMQGAIEGKVQIDGEIRVFSIITKKSAFFNVYKNGHFYKKVWPEHEEGSYVYRFSFKEDKPIDTPNNYIIEFPYHMISSPIILRPVKKGSPVILRPPNEKPEIEEGICYH